MTNRSKAVKVNNPLRYLDLSFEGRQQANTQELNNGIKPHGGYRGRKKHPLSHVSFDKNREYHEKLREDIDKLLEEEELNVHGSPAWVSEANREVSHGGESPLIVNKFLAASRVEPPRSAQSRPRSVRSARNSDVPPPKTESLMYYRPNRTHQYLTSTDLKDCSQSESNIKYGRPTRTTLLRARQRSNSAPVNAYEVRREMIKRAEERKSKSYLKNKQDVLNVYSGYGESQHSWLIGARYNRAHLVDARTFSLYGMYMPRNNPMGCFVTHSLTNLVKDADEFSCPSAPPDTPRSDEGGEVAQNYSQRVHSAPMARKLYISSSPPTTKQAWGESATPGTEFVKEGDIVKQNGDQAPEDGANKSDAINVKGSRVFAPRSESVRRQILPTVQGVSWRSPRRRDTTEESMTSHPPPPTPLGFGTSSQKDQSENMKLEDLITKRSYNSSRGPPSDKSPSDPPKEEQKLSAPKKIKPVLVDRSVNVPSISGDSWVHGARVQSARPQSVGGHLSMFAPERTSQKMDVEKKSENENNKGQGGTSLILEPVEDNVLQDPEVPINSPEGTAHMTSPCSDGNGSQIGNNVVLSPTQMVSSNETQKMAHDPAAFFITEKAGDKSEENTSTDAEKELEQLSVEENDLQLRDADKNIDTNDAYNVEPVYSLGNASARSERDIVDNDEENISPTPVTQVKVDISKKLDS